MGSRLRLTAGRADVVRAWQLVRPIFIDTERALTRFDAHSPLSRLNAHAGDGRSHCVEPMLVTALVEAQRAFRATDGAFDPRVLGALERAGERAGVPLPPSPPALRPDDPWLSVEGAARVQLEAPVDLGGIGKGLALRWAGAALSDAGITPYLLEAGGDLVADATPDTCWGVAIEYPGRPDPAAVINLRRGAVATSSLAVRSWHGAGGLRAHHLIDPVTGRPARSDYVSVTVALDDPADAEVLTKLGFLRGLRRVAGVPAWAVTRAGEVELTPPAAARTSWPPAAASVLSEAAV